jgi:translation initiation factor IF-2
MSDDNKPKLGTRAPLGLKRTVETGQVKQSFSHGRSNTVVVEVKRRRVVGKPGEAGAPDAPVAAEVEVVTPVAAPAAPAPQPQAARPAPAPQARATRAPAAGGDLMSRQELQAKLLREAEEARMTALEEARRRDERAKQEASEEERRRAEDNRKAEEIAREAPEPVAVETETSAAEPAAPVAVSEPEARTAPSASDDGRPGHAARRPVGGAPAPKRPEPARPSRGRVDDRRQSGKLTVTRALDEEGGDARARSLAALKRAREKDRRAHQGGGQQAKQVRDVQVPESITVQELANRMAERGAALVKSYRN